MLWEVDIHPAEGQPDLVGQRTAAAAEEMNLLAGMAVATARGFLIQGDGLDAATIRRVASELLADGVVEQTIVGKVGDACLSATPSHIDSHDNNLPAQLISVLPKAGVMDPVAQSAQEAIVDQGIETTAVRTLRKYWFANSSRQTVQTVASRILANDAIEQVVFGPLNMNRLEIGSTCEFQLQKVSLSDLDDEGLMQLSRTGQLYLQLAEMQTIQHYFADLGRAPTDIELETIAQTWSEHCSHKTLAGRIAYHDENGPRRFENMLKETIFAATQQIRAQLGNDDWCVSVFEDNAGIVRFDERYNVAFKVETHNHPSALEPYGGANTGIGGVIRDIMGTGLGAKPVCSTDVFCFASPDTPEDDIPPGVLHPRRVMRGVVEGVRDYGNRMGIPTVNGAIYFDERYLGNPLVYCGNVGLIPQEKSHKEPQPNDLIVAVGGRTGRDGIHGATFSSAELTSQSEELSGGAVQIGNAIEEKKVLDILLTARDRELYSAITDCGAGGFSSAVGEMGETIGAEVWLDRAPLKYQGLSYTEIWISEAQERMVLAVPENRWEKLAELCQSEGVEATVIGRYVPTGRLKLKYRDHEVADLDMQFLHHGRPPVVREATYKVSEVKPLAPPEKLDYTDDLLRVLRSLNVASKEWVIRQYDHEVQGSSVIKPLVGTTYDGPSDAAVVRPVLDSRRGIVIACGMNPYYGDLDTYHMAASALDEAIRNCVAVGADPSRIAVLDNFCWGDCEKPETLGTLVRAALACHDGAVALGTPFISGKDSLNNEFSFADANGQRQTIAIPPSLLISALGQVDDVAKCVTMDLKQAGNLLYQVGTTKNELGGSHFALVNNLTGGQVPVVDFDVARQTFEAIHRSIQAGCIVSCHDLSEGGLAVAAAEMAFAGGLGASIDLDQVSPGLASDRNGTIPTVVLLFAESNSRFLCEVPPHCAARFEELLAGLPVCRIGEVRHDQEFVMECNQEESPRIQLNIHAAKEAWQMPFSW